MSRIGTDAEEGTTDVVVVGAGVIGLACAWRLAQRAQRVTLFDPTPGRGASWAAAGMLAPVTEAHYGEEALVRFNLSSATAWPAFAAELEEVSGAEVGYRPCGTMAVAADAADMAALEELYRFQRSLELPAELLRPGACREFEPLLAPTVRGGLLANGDHQVDNRLLVRALELAAGRAGVVMSTARVTGLVMKDLRVVGVHLDGGTQVSSENVLLAAGCWSAQGLGLPAGVVPPVRPVKGVILRLRGSPILARNLRAMVKGASIYLVPRSDGRVALGATVEEQGFDTTVRAGSVADLLADARAVLPALDELELVETHAGLRPGTPDNVPILGRSALEGLVIATGHFRNGVLLTPATADAITQVVCDATAPEAIAAFSPRRWEPATIPATQ